MPTLAPSLAGSPRVNGHRDYVIKTLLHGLSGPIDGKSYPQVMVAMGSNKDQWIADITSYVRNSFGNTGIVGHAGRRRQGPGRDRRPDDAVDGRGARRVAAAAAGSRMRSGKPPPATIRGRRRRRTPRAATTSSATPPARSASWAGRPAYRSRRACGSRSNCRRRASLTEIQFTSSSIGGRGGAPPQWTFPRGYQVQVSADGTTWSAPVAEGEGAPGHHRDHVRAGQREVRADHANRHGRERAAVVDAAAPSLRAP